MNPFNVLRSVFQYLRGFSNPVSTQGGGSGLLWMLAYLAWANSGSSRSSRRRRYTRSGSCIYNRDSFSDAEQGASNVVKMDTISEGDEHRTHSPSTSSTAETIRSPSSITNAQVYARNILQVLQGNLSESNAGNSGIHDLNPLELVSFVNKKKKGQFRNSSEESDHPTPSRRRNKVALKRLQKKTRRQLKKREDTEELKGCRNKKCEHGAETSSNRFINIRSCCNCCYYRKI